MGKLIPRKKRKELEIPENCHARACAKRDYNKKVLRKEDVILFSKNKIL